MSLAARWGLDVGPPWPATYHRVAPATRRDGSPAVLKLGRPGEPGLAREAAVLRAWGGRGAVRLLEADVEAGALLLERALPGTPLWELPDEAATDAVAAVVRRLRRPPAGPSGLPTVADWGKGFARHRSAHGGGSGPLPVDLFAAAERRFADLCHSSAEPVLLHGDLHHGNVLCAEREPWLAIDPKGVLGEPAYEPGAFLRNPIGGPGGDGAAVARRRLDRLAGALELDRGRVRDWAFAQAVLSAVWSLEDHGGGWEGAMAWAGVMSTA